ncbi:MAG: YbaK/EbsC family protein [Motiliproteus sp.]
MLSHQIYAYLDQARVPYQRIEATSPYSPSPAGHSSPGHSGLISKTVVLEIDNQLALLVFPANHRVDLKELCRSIRCYSITLPNDARITSSIHDYQRDTITPLGNLYGLDVYLAESLSQQPDITFRAGDQNELVRMPYDQFAKLVEPIIVRYGCLAP